MAKSAEYADLIIRMHAAAAARCVRHGHVDGRRVPRVQALFC